MQRLSVMHEMPSTSVRCAGAGFALSSRYVGHVNFLSSSRGGRAQRMSRGRLRCSAAVLVDNESLAIPSWYKLAPEPVRFPRGALKRSLAVLLMRSTYEALDDLDYCPTDEFQVSFWKLRAAEQEAYQIQYSPLKFRQGDLTDPLYFDFISFAQYLAVNKEMKLGKQVFIERIGAEAEERTVRRDQAIADNALLPAAMATLIGDKIYEGLVEGFQEEVFGAPGPCPKGKLDKECILQGMKGVAESMARGGYCIKTEIVPAADEVAASGELRFTLRLVGPANLWGMTNLSGKRLPLLNDYVGFAEKSFLRASGRTGQYKTSITDVGLEQTWVVK